MKILDWFSGLFKSRDKPQNSYRFSTFPFFFGKSISGKNVNEFTAMQTSAVYGCIKVIAEAVASLPLHVYKYTDKGKERAPDHKLYYLLHDAPNPDMTAFAFLEMLITHLLLYGNSYFQIIRNGLGQVMNLYPLSPNRISVERDDNGELWYIYTPDEANPNFRKYKQIQLSRDEVLHIYGLSFNGLVGYSPIAIAKNAIGLSIACEDFGNNFFANGARPSGILKTPTLIKDPQKLQESWQSMYGGANAGKVAILEQGMEYQPISIPPNDAQFLESRRFQLEEIARIFRVPLAFLNDLEHATYSNVEQQSLNFVIYTLTPYLVRIEQAINKTLFLPSERGKFYVKFNVGGLLRGDIKSRYEAYAIGRQQGFLSSNDIRELEDMNLISDEDGGNSFLINGNMTKLSDAGLFGKKNSGDTNAAE